MHNSRWEFSYNICADCPQASIHVYLNFKETLWCCKMGSLIHIIPKRIKDSGSFKWILMIALMLLITWELAENWKGNSMNLMKHLVSAEQEEQTVEEATNNLLHK